MPYVAHYYKLNDLVVSTPAMAVNTLNPGGGFSGRRWAASRRAGIDGVALPTDLRAPERVLRLPITLMPADSTGATTDPWYQRLCTNKADLFTELNSGVIDLRWRMPFDNVDGWIELQTDAVATEQFDIVTRSALWDVVIGLALPHPWWRELPQIQVGATTSHTVNTGGSAPITHMQITFTADGTWTDGTTTITVSGMTGSALVIDTKARTIEEDGANATALVEFSNGMPRWNPQSTINVSSSTPVAVDYWRSWE
jgi:hypothetical protein